MEDKSFQLDIVTPQKIIFSAKVISFTAPGFEGGFQVLHSHAPYLVALKIGAVKIIEPVGKTSYFATSGGFVEVHSNKVIMLAESAESTDSVDRKRAIEVLERTHQQRLKEAQDVKSDVARGAIFKTTKIN
jgi:F-type H+-transporting ATPase subunit epsilon